MISVRDRQSGRVFHEQVYGEGALRWAYGTKIGRTLEKAILSRPVISKIMGAFQNTPSSTGRIPSFIQQYGIQMEEFEPGPFDSFNDFFIRKFKAGSRPFAPAPALAAFAEARYFAWDSTSESTVLPVKGAQLCPRLLLAGALDAEQAGRLSGGPLLLARLCPTDYHRFHFPDSGDWLSCRRVQGRLHSVNPVALEARPRTFLDNERQVSLLKCDTLGLLAFIEVGALGVGKIIQSRKAGRFGRGDEKGYFLFGGSTVIVIGEPGRWKPDSDLLEATRSGMETLIRLGDGIAR